MSAANPVVLKATVLKDKPKRIESSDVRNLRVENEALRKELERKELRSENQLKELQSLRLNVSNLQRELRTINGVYEKAQADRQAFMSEHGKLREYIDRLEKQNYRLADSQSLLTAIDKSQDQIAYLEGELGKLNAILTGRDERIRALERELEIINRSLESQIQYGDGISSSQQGREMMRALYYELGKKKTDLQNLAATLSASSDEIEFLQRQLREACNQNSELEANLQDLNSRYESLFSENGANMMTIKELELRANSGEQAVDVANRKIEDLTRQLVEVTSKRDDISVESKKQIALLQVELESRVQEITSLKTHITGMQQTVSHTENVRQLMERQRDSERDSISLERKQLQDKVSRCFELEVEIEQVRNKLILADRAKDELTSELDSMQEKMQRETASWQDEVNHRDSKIRALEDKLSVSQSKLQLSEKERDEAILALKQTMTATKDLNVKFKQEVAAKLVAEQRLRNADQTIHEIEKSKMELSAAVMDALAKERGKVSALESMIARTTGPTNVLSGRKQVPHRSLAESRDRRYSVANDENDFDNNSAESKELDRSNIFDQSWVGIGSGANKELVVQALEQHLPPVQQSLKQDVSAPLNLPRFPTRETYQQPDQQLRTMSYDSFGAGSVGSSAPPLASSRDRGNTHPSSQTSGRGNTSERSSIQGSPEPDPVARAPAPSLPPHHPYSNKFPKDAESSLVPDLDSSFDSNSDSISFSTAGDRQSIPGYRQQPNIVRSSWDSQSQTSRLDSRQSLDLPTPPVSNTYDAKPIDSARSDSDRYLPREEKHPQISQVDVVTDRNTSIGSNILRSSASSMDNAVRADRSSENTTAPSTGKQPLTMVEELKRLRAELMKMEKKIPAPMSPSETGELFFWEHKVSSPHRIGANAIISQSSTSSSTNSSLRSVNDRLSGTSSTRPDHRVSTSRTNSATGDRGGEAVMVSMSLSVSGGSGEADEDATSYVTSRSGSFDRSIAGLSSQSASINRFPH